VYVIVCSAASIEVCFNGNEDRHMCRKRQRLDSDNSHRGTTDPIAPALGRSFGQLSRRVLDPALEPSGAIGHVLDLVEVIPAALALYETAIVTGTAGPRRARMRAASAYNSKIRGGCRSTSNFIGADVWSRAGVRPRRIETVKVRQNDAMIYGRTARVDVQRCI
jgi:hypothetical protein